MTESRELTDEEAIEAFRLSNYENRLPDLPLIEGYHVCWLSKTNMALPIHTAISRYKFQLIKAEEYPGFAHHAQVKEGDYPGCVVVNEMVAAKLPLKLFQAYMADAHHRKPLEQAAAIYRGAQAKASELAGGKSSLQLGGGTRALARDPGCPDFTRMYGEGGEPYAPRELEIERLRDEEDSEDPRERTLL